MNEELTATVEDMEEVLQDNKTYRDLSFELLSRIKAWRDTVKKVIREEA